MQIGIFVQARMSSRRCPGKVLRTIARKPLLKHLLDSLQHSQLACGITVLTSDQASDDPIAEFCAKQGIHYFRGSLDNVADRFASAVAETNWDAFVRICADSPLLDYRLVDRAIRLYQTSNVDLVTNVAPRSYPAGQSIELIRASTFLNGVKQMTEAEDREHVMPWFYRSLTPDRRINFSAERIASYPKMGVDTEQEFETVSRLISSLALPVWRYPWEDLAALLTQPEETNSNRTEVAA